MEEKKGVTGHLRSRNGLTDTSTWPMYVCIVTISITPCSSTSCASTDIDLGILKALLQILINCLIRNFADQGKVRHADFFLLRALKHRFSNFRLPSPIICPFRGCQIFLSAGAFCNTLVPWTSVTWAGTHNMISARTIPPSLFLLIQLALYQEDQGWLESPGFSIRQCSGRD